MNCKQGAAKKIAICFPFSAETAWSFDANFFIFLFHVSAYVYLLSIIVLGYLHNGEAIGFWRDKAKKISFVKFC